MSKDKSSDDILRGTSRMLLWSTILFSGLLGIFIGGVIVILVKGT